MSSFTFNETVVQRLKDVKEDASLPRKQAKSKTVVGTPVNIATNLRQLDLDPNMSIFKYDVNVKIFYRKDGNEADVEISKSTKKGAEHEADKARCRKIYEKLVQSKPALQKGKFFYDRQASLYSLTKLKDEIEATFSDSSISGRDSFIRAHIKILPVAETFQATTNGIKATANPCPEKSDKSLLEALAMMVNGPATENESVIHGNGGVHYIDPNSGEVPITLAKVHMEGGKKTPVVGTSNTVSTLEGSTPGKPTLYVCTEFKSTLLHPGGPLLDVVKSYGRFNANCANWKANSAEGMKVSKAIKGLEVRVNYGKDLPEERPAFKIRRLGASARESTFDVNGVPTTVLRHFQEKNGIKLRYPDMFTIEVRSHGRTLHFPVEALDLFPNQTVTNEQMSGKEQSEMIKLSAAKPQDRKNNTELVAQTIGVVGNNKTDVIKIGAPVKLVGFVLPKPEIVFGGNKKVDWIRESQNRKGAPTDFSFPGQYIAPIKLTNWEIVFVKNEVLERAVTNLKDQINSCGMSPSDPVISFIGSENKLEDIFAKAKAAKRQILFFITRSHYNYHQSIKALEQRFDLLTQDIRFETAEKWGSNTIQNIVHKTNMKLGGVNYRINGSAFKVPRIFIGFETAQQGSGGDIPVSVGFSANMLQEPTTFGGGYVYTIKKNGETYGPIIKTVLAKVFKTMRGFLRTKPAEIVLFFSGVPESQYHRCAAVYSEEVHKACADVGPGMRPNVTIIAATKTHNQRFYKADGTGAVSNLEPGTVIDHTIVSPVANQWYQTGAVARQGTVKATKYTLIYSNYPEQDLPPIAEYQKTINELSFNHQIVFQPVSLPAPLYEAGANSQRGAMIVAQRGAVMKDGQIDLEATNQQLGYWDSALFEKRFNA